MRPIPWRLIAVSAATVLLVTSCGRSPQTTTAAQSAPASSSATASGTVTVWAMGAEGAALGTFVKKFEAQNPGIKVQVTAIPWSAAHDKIQTAIAAGTTPDLAQMGTTWTTDFSDAFATVPSSVSTSGFFSTSLHTAQVNGRTVGLPWYVDTRVLFYRTDIAKKAGWTSPPTTWSQLKQMAADMQSKGGAKYGIRLPTAGFGSFRDSMFLPWSNGASLLSPDGKHWTFDTPQMVQAYQYLESFFKDGIANQNVDTSNGAEQAEFVAGTTPMFIDGPFNMGLLAKLGGPGFAAKYATAVLPTKVSGTSFVGGSNLVVFKGAKNPAAAWKLAEWLSQPQVQVQWWKTTGDLPAVESSWQDPALAKDPKLSVFGQQLKDTKTTPSVPTWTKVSADADTALEEITQGKLTPSEALKKLQQQADAIGVQ